MAPDRFSWLHLTDFHFGMRGQRTLWPNLREPFLKDLAELHDRAGPWHAVLFTGDFVQSGNSTQFEDMQREVLDRLWIKLRELGSGDAVLLAVPGNHDLTRPDRKADNPAIDALLRKDGFSDIANKFWEMEDGAYRRVINEAFGAYQNWWNGVPYRPKALLVNGMLPGDFACSLQCGSYTIGIIGLNTTFLQLQEGDYRGYLEWNSRQIDAVSNGAIDDWVKNHRVCLLLTHQGPEWLTPASRNHGESEIAPAGRFVGHLFGHMHETRIIYESKGGSDTIRRCQSRSAFGMELFGDPPELKRSHGYISGRIEFSEKGANLRLWPRIATDKPNGWRFIPDHDNVLDHDGATRPEKISYRSTDVIASVSPAEFVTHPPRSDFITIPKRAWPESVTKQGFEMPDSMLLRPESRVVRFHHLRRPLVEAIIGWVLGRDELIKLRLQAGEGGAGKTRLMIEVCEQLETAYGWRAGFVERSQSDNAGLRRLLSEGRPSVIVLDYAETRVTEIVEITRTALYASNIPYVRLLLLAREGGDWWDRLADAAGGDQAVAAILRGLRTKTGPYRMSKDVIEKQDRPAIFAEALEDFAAFKRSEIPRAVTPDLSADYFGNPLFIHLSALAQLRERSSLDDSELLSTELGHERSYWRKLWNDEATADQMLPAIEQAVALLTLINGRRSGRDAKAALASVPRLRNLPETTQICVFDMLRQIYPYPQNGGLKGLEPDLLGETLVGEALARDDELLAIGRKRTTCDTH